MNTFFRYLFLFLNRYLGVKRVLNPPAKRLAWMASVYGFTMAFSNFFLNVFLFKGNSDWNVVINYNLMSFLLIPPMFGVGGWIARKGRKLWPYRAGLAFSAILFLAMLLFRDDARDHVLLLGFLNGLAIGFYFLGQHELTFDVTTPETRDLYFSLQQFVASILRIGAMPLASGIITLFRTEGSADRGYYVLFAMTLALYLALFAETFAFRFEDFRAPFRIWDAWRDHWTPSMRPVMVAYFVWGLRNGPFWFLMAVLVYRASHRELTVGAYDMLTQGIMLAMTYLLARWATRRNRGNGLGVSAWLDVLGVTLLAWRLDASTLLAFTILLGVSGALFQVTFTSYSFDIMGAAQGGEQRTLENLTIREVPLNLGRIVGLLIFQACCNHFGEAGLRWSVLFLGSAHVGVWWILTRYYPDPGRA